MGRRHGHGRLEFSEGKGTYTGSWEGDERNGYGVFDNPIKLVDYKLAIWFSIPHNIMLPVFCISNALCLIEQTDGAILCSC